MDFKVNVDQYRIKTVPIVRVVLKPIQNGFTVDRCCLKNKEFREKTSKIYAEQRI